MGLVDLSIVKAELEVTDTSEDVILQRYIDIISAKIEKVLGRKLESQSYTEKYIGSDTTKLVLNNYPIISVEEILYFENEIDDYEIQNANSGILYREGIWESERYRSLMNNSPVEAIKNIEIEYTAGYETIPLDIQDIVVQEVSRRRDKAYRTGQLKSWKLDNAGKSFEGVTIDQDSGMLSSNINYLINNYKDKVI